MSCNGCRVLRKGCSETCVLWSSLDWIQCPDSQGHAVLFVSKFFGRSNLVAFISAVPPNKRPALFQSLLFEACGRMVNPVNGSNSFRTGSLKIGNQYSHYKSSVRTDPKIYSVAGIRGISRSFKPEIQPMDTTSFRSEEEEEEDRIWVSRRRWLSFPAKNSPEKMKTPAPAPE